MKHYKTFALILILLLSTNLQAKLIKKPYKVGIGFQFATGNNGLSLKSFLAPKHSVEGIVYAFNTDLKEVNIAGLYNFTLPFDKNDQEMRFGLGGGAHFGFIKEDGLWIAGPDLQIGVEYTIQKAPFSLGADWIPSYDILGRNQLNYRKIGFTLRFTFK